MVEGESIKWAIFDRYATPKQKISSLIVRRRGTFKTLLWYVFCCCVSSLNNVYISEAHGKGEPEDYIEIHNQGDEPCDLKGFKLMTDFDGEDEFEFTESTILQSDEYFTLYIRILMLSCC